MSEPIYQIIYISTANPELDEDALMELLSASQKRNADRDITGLLLHADSNIIQVLEGPEDEVKDLYKTISKDTRHRGVTTISSRIVKARDFPEFKMGFKRADGKDIEEHLPGFTDIVEQRAISEENLKGLSKLVATFIRTFAKATRIDKFGPA